jgi:hypothetical protein
MEFEEGLRVVSSNWISTLLGPVTLPLVPTIQRISYWANLSGKDKDYDTYRKDHELLSPYVLGPMASASSWKYTPILHFRNCTQEEFSEDIKKTQLLIGNHVGFSDFAILIQVARYYNVESNFIAYFMNSLNKWPFIGPTLWGQIPLSRDGTGRDETTLNSRLTMIKNSSYNHLFAIFPEGGLRRNPKLHDRTVEKNENYGLHLEYMNFPKVKGFTKLVEIVGDKIDNVYEFTLFYEKKRKLMWNDVHVTVTKVCKVSELPKCPSSDYIQNHSLKIDDSNRLHYAHEEYLLNRFLMMDQKLKVFYSNLPEDERPTVENLHKWRFPDKEDEEHADHDDQK